MILTYHSIGKDQAMVDFVSRTARNGQRVHLLTTKDKAAFYRKAILKHNQGTWPIGLRVITTL